ncbi:hypothetical protein OG871_39235 [Kitasatospora sp. NBC_00374]
MARTKSSAGSGLRSSVSPGVMWEASRTKPAATAALEAAATM